MISYMIPYRVWHIITCVRHGYGILKLLSFGLHYTLRMWVRINNMHGPDLTLYSVLCFLQPMWVSITCLPPASVVGVIKLVPSVSVSVCLSVSYYSRMMFGFGSMRLRSDPTWIETKGSILSILRFKDVTQYYL